MIKFRDIQDSQDVTVLLDGKVVGKIKCSPRGYKYFPKGSRVGGEWFSTLIACKQSLLD